MLWPKTYIAWDLETTGLSPEKDKILEIGMMLVRDGIVVESKNWMLNHGIKVPANITQITGITQEMVDAGVNPKSAIDEFIGMFDAVGYANLTHNGFRFDIPFLLTALVRDSTFDYVEQGELKKLLYKNGMDSAVLYKARSLNLTQKEGESFPWFAKRVMDIKAFGVKYNVAHCCKDLQVDTEGATFHRALGDVDLTHKIFQKIISN